MLTRIRTLIRVGSSFRNIKSPRFTPSRVLRQLASSEMAIATIDIRIKSFTDDFAYAKKGRGFCPLPKNLKY